MPSSLRSERYWWGVWRLFSLNWMRIFKVGNIEWCWVPKMMPHSWAIWVLFNLHSSPECLILLPKRLFSPLPPVVVRIRHPDKTSFCHSSVLCLFLTPPSSPTFPPNQPPSLKYYFCGSSRFESQIQIMSGGSGLRLNTEMQSLVWYNLVDIASLSRASSVNPRAIL